MAQLNTYADVSAIAQAVQEDAIFVIREVGTMQKLVTVFTDMSGLNPRTGYKYNQASASDIAEADDLTSSAFTPSADQTLTPSEIGLQFFLTDSRIESDLPENIRTDAAQELGFAAADKVEGDLLAEMANMTGGTIGTAGSAITWGYVAAAIAQARYINKSNSVALGCALHGYQWALLAKGATVAGATVAATAPNWQDQLTRPGYVAEFMGVPFYQVHAAPNSLDDFTGGVFPRPTIAIDWRRRVRVEPQRDASRRGWELNMSAVYAHGVWRPDRGVQMIFDATAPTS